MKTKTDPYGRVVVSADDAFELLLAGLSVDDFLVEDGPKVRAFNDLVSWRDQKVRLTVADDPPHSPREEHEGRTGTWLIPDEYRTLDVLELCARKCENDDQIERVALEWQMFEERGLVPILQTMVYLVDHFREKGIVWGVGRGSSVSSYILFLIGVHKVDSLKYELDIRDFLR